VSPNRQTFASVDIYNSLICVLICVLKLMCLLLYSSVSYKTLTSQPKNLFARKLENLRRPSNQRTKNFLCIYALCFYNLLYALEINADTHLKQQQK
jgi:hypothetical protein